tara:strand:- start:82 stop:279 length:198 start_codon:yes stop_codon:yes gene_type:complete
LSERQFVAAVIIVSKGLRMTDGYWERSNSTEVEQTIKQKSQAKDAEKVLDDALDWVKIIHSSSQP